MDGMDMKGRLGFINLAQVVMVIELAGPDDSAQYDKTCPYKHMLFSDQTNHSNLL